MEQILHNRAEFEAILSSLRISKLVSFDHANGAGFDDYDVQRAVGRCFVLLGIDEIQVEMMERENLEGYFRYVDPWQAITWSRPADCWTLQAAAALVKAIEPALSAAAAAMTEIGRDRRRQLYRQGIFGIVSKDDEDTVQNNHDFGARLRLSLAGNRVEAGMIECATPTDILDAPEP